MKAIKKQRLERAGWKVGGTRVFLKLTAEEAAYIEVKLAAERVLKKDANQKAAQPS